MPQAVTGLAESLLKDPVRVAVTPSSTTVELVEQRVLFVAKADKRAPAGPGPARPGDPPGAGLHPHQARRQPRHRELAKAGIAAGAIHGNKSQAPARRRWAISRPATIYRQDDRLFRGPAGWALKLRGS